MTNTLKPTGPKNRESAGWQAQKPALRNGEAVAEGIQMAKDRVVVLEHARLFEHEGLDIATAELLLAHGTIDDARQFISRIEKSECITSKYAKALVRLKEGNLSAAARISEGLKQKGARGLYFSGMIMAEVSPADAEESADILSGKPRKHECKTAFQVRSTDDVGAMAGSIFSAILCSMDDPEENQFLALRIYQKLGNEEGVGRCLHNLRETDGNYYLYALRALGRDLQNQDLGTLYLEGESVKEMAEGRHHELVSNIENRWFPDDLEKKHDAYERIIFEVNRFLFGVHPGLGEEALALLIRRKNMVKAEITERELGKLKEIETVLAAGDFKSVVVASDMLQQVDFRFLDRDVTNHDTDRLAYRKRLADAAFSFERDGEAQVFASKEYCHNDIPRAIACAERLLGMMELESAEEIFRSLEDKLDENQACKLARKHEKTATLVSLRLYIRAGDQEGVERCTGAILAQGSLEQIEAASWALSARYKKSALMMETLRALKGFGEEGEKRGRLICTEMCIETDLFDHSSMPN